MKHATEYTVWHFGSECISVQSEKHYLYAIIDGLNSYPVSTSM